MRWLYPTNIGTAILDGQLTTVLIDSRARMNCVTLEFMKARGLVAGSIQDLNNHSGCILINGVGGKRTEPLGYVMIRVQVPQAPSYDEDQVALIVEDPSLFSRRCPIILGTPTIFRAIQAMKESEMHNLKLAWQYVKGGAPRAETEDIQIIEEEERVDQEVILRTTQLARQDKKFHNLRTEGPGDTPCTGMAPTTKE